MNEVLAVLETAEDADASSEEEVQLRQPGRDPKTGQFVPTGYVDDSIDTSPLVVEAEAEEPEPDEEPESEVDSSPTVDDADDENADNEPEYGERTQARIDELTGNFMSTQRLYEETLAELDKAKAALAAVPKVVEPLKTLEDFGYDGAAFSEYILTESAERAKSVVKETLQEYDSTRSSQQNATAFREAEQKFAEKHADYDQKVYGEVDGRRGWEANDVMAREIRLTENGWELAYHLATHPDIASKIMKLPERSAVLEMDKLHRQLESGKAEVRTAKKKVTKAPPPPPSLKGGDAGIKPKGYYEGMSDAEFDAMRRKEIAHR